MENNVFDEDFVNELYKEVAKSSKRDDIVFLFFGGIIFGFGYLMLLINGYYHFKSIEFLQIGRKDLIARLGLISFAIGYLYYPTSIILIGIINWIINNGIRKGILRKMIFSTLGLIIPAIFLYGKIKVDFLFGPKEKWIIGIVLIIISIFIFLKENLKL